MKSLRNKALFLSSAISVSAVGFAQTTAGLIAHYTFEGNALDQSGNSNNATPLGSFGYLAGGHTGWKPVPQRTQVSAQLVTVLGASYRAGDGDVGSIRTLRVADRGAHLGLPAARLGSRVHLQLLLQHQRTALGLPHRLSGAEPRPPVVRRRGALVSDDPGVDREHSTTG